MERKKISSDLQIRVKKYFQYKSKIEDDKLKNKENLLLSSLTASLREELTLESKAPILKQFTFLMKNFSEYSLRKLVWKMNLLNFSPEEIIFKVINCIKIN